MYIHDVIGSLRATYLNVQEEIAALRLRVTMLEHHVQCDECQRVVSRETKHEPEVEDDGQDTLF